MASRVQWTRADLTELVLRVPGYRDALRVVDEMDDVVKALKSLKPKVDQLVRNDGSEGTMVCLDGTIPMFHNQKKYNCPLCIWINLDFPSSPPTCYVKPTQDMAIKPRHVHVDSAGFVYHGYLTTWTHQSTLKILCDTLTAAFSQDSPVYAVPGGGGARPPQPRSQPQQPALSQPPVYQPPAQPQHQPQPQVVSPQHVVPPVPQLPPPQHDSWPAHRRPWS
ncbi:UEV domain-containing protein [Baffinella frigidus]|nr:UEV domain-containing protein [Cryptophyta sp. CCMP2293]